MKPKQKTKQAHPNYFKRGAGTKKILKPAVQAELQGNFFCSWICMMSERGDIPDLTVSPEATTTSSKLLFEVRGCNMQLLKRRIGSCTVVVRCLHTVIMRMNVMIIWGFSLNCYVSTLEWLHSIHLNDFLCTSHFGFSLIRTVYIQSQIYTHTHFSLLRNGTKESTVSLLNYSWYFLTALIELTNSQNYGRIKGTQ